MEQINLSEFLSLFGCTRVDDCCLSTDYIIDESGITAKYSDDDSIARFNYYEGVKLSFPCTAQDLFYWAKGLENQGYYFVKELPKWFVDKWLPNYMLFRVWCSQTDTVKGVGTDKPFDVNWAYWLTLAKEWTKKEAALLIFELEPGQFKEVDINANDLTMCDPLYKLLLLPENLKLPPFDWLNWFNENGYLDYAPKSLQDWFKAKSSILVPVGDELLSRDEENSIKFNYGVTKSVIRRKAGAIASKDGWQDWLDLPEWTPEQAICLLYETNPFDYCKIESNEQIKMLKLRANFKGNMTPFDWLNWFDEIGYLINASKPLRDWFNQQSNIVALQAEAVVDDGAADQDDTRLEQSESNESDISLGRAYRERLTGFANRNKEKSEERQEQWKKWKAEGERIQNDRTRKLSKVQLAKKVKESLKLPDAIGTIRKKI